MTGILFFLVDFTQMLEINFVYMADKSIQYTTATQSALFHLFVLAHLPFLLVSINELFWLLRSVLLFMYWTSFSFS